MKNLQAFDVCNLLITKLKEVLLQEKLIKNYLLKKKAQTKK